MLHGPSMLVDLISDGTNVHVAGLAAMLLAICLLSTNDGDFLQVTSVGHRRQPCPAP